MPSLLVAFRMTEDERAALRAAANEHAEGNVSRLIREALAEQYAELRPLVDRDQAAK